MTTQSFRSLLAILLFVTPFADAAQAAVAVLEQVSGHPAIYEVGPAGARAASLPRQGAEYTLPIEIETGARDTATFRLPDSEVSVAPNTVIRVAAPEPADGGLLQRIFQRAGAALFSVDRHDVEHFRVETPFLVSVVKGTTFNVVVHDDGATVSLHEGRLLVDSVDGSQRVELAPGDVVFSGRDGSLKTLAHTVVQREPMDATTANAGDGGLAAPVQPTVTGEPQLGGDVAALQDSVADALTVDAGDDLADGLVDDAGDATGDLVGDISGGTSDLVGDLDGSTGDLVGDLGDAGGDLVSDVGDSAGDLLGSVNEDVGDLAEDVGGTAGDLVADTADTTGDLVDDLGDTTGDLIDDATDTTGDLTGDLADTTGDLTASIVEAGDDLTAGLDDGLEETEEDLGDTLGGVLGGLGL